MNSNQPAFGTSRHGRGGMLKSRKFVAVVILLLTALCTLYLLRSPEQIQSLEESASSLLQDHHAHEENTPLLPASSLLHPIHQLVSQAESDFQTLRARQSRSLNDAVAEYRRRYKIPPPPHFDKWYNFAKKRG